MSALKGDYMGFTYNGEHSSDLGIVRVSEGSRFNENLLPTVKDTTVQVPGGDGTYYFGSEYTQRQFTISFAFDSLTEQQLEKLRKHFGDKKIHDLIFDEMPYKIYSAKVTGNATIKYIPFSEGETNRIYKGEGSLQFTCYDPFARCERKFLNEYDKDIYPNKGEWAAASGLKETKGKYDTLNNGEILLYNPGVKETDWILTLPTSGISGYKISFGNTTGLTLRWENSLNKTVQELQLNSKTNLVKCSVGNEDDKKKLYNEYLTDGDFFKIPQGESVLTVKTLDDANATDASIIYNYYYF